MDLFDDETDEEKKAAEGREAAKKDTKKPKESKPLFVLLKACVLWDEFIMISSHLFLIWKSWLGG